MNTRSKKMLCVVFGLLSMSFMNGCYSTQDVTIETRFAETKQPAPGNLSYMHPSYAVWPPPPRFEPVFSDDGFFDIKLVNNRIWCYFRLTNHEELVPPYKFIINLKDKKAIKWDDPGESDWKEMYSRKNSSYGGPPESYPDIEYRVILPSK